MLFKGEVPLIATPGERQYRSFCYPRGCNFFHGLHESLRNSFEYLSLRQFLVPPRSLKGISPHSISLIQCFENTDDCNCAGTIWWRGTLIGGMTMRLFIAETNDRVRQSLASIAASVEGIEVVGEASDVGSAVGAVRRVRPDSVIVALPMSGGSGLDVLSAAKGTNPASVAIMLTQSPCMECQRKCFDMGADYFFEKSSATKKLITTLVLLAHQSSQQQAAGMPEANSPISGSFDTMSDQSQSAFSLGPKSCPRLAALSTPGTRVCFLVGNPRYALSVPHL
jgi:DNA-binding NarL/FixJ family response regulator